MEYRIRVSSSQLIRASDFQSEGCGFESHLAHNCGISSKEERNVANVEVEISKFLYRTMNLKELKKEERKLFDTYNWRAPNDVKIAHLQKLINAIKKIKELER